jgi:hypothetical protein
MNHYNDLKWAIALGIVILITGIFIGTKYEQRNQTSHTDTVTVTKIITDTLRVEVKEIKPIVKTKYEYVASHDTVFVYPLSQLDYKDSVLTAQVKYNGKQDMFDFKYQYLREKEVTTVTIKETVRIDPSHWAVSATVFNDGLMVSGNYTVTSMFGVNIQLGLGYKIK